MREAYARQSAAKKGKTWTAPQRESHEAALCKPEVRSRMPQAAQARPSVTDITKAKLSASGRRTWRSYTPEERSTRIRNMLRKKPQTSLEVAVESVLQHVGAVYVAEHPLGRYIVDFYLPELAVVIEADGEYWHSVPHVVAKDRRKNAWLRRQGYRVIHLRESKIRADALYWLLRAVPELRSAA